MTARRSKFGPEPKGVRQQLTVRIPVDVLEAIKDQALEEGLPLGDVISNRLAAAYHLPPIARPRRSGFTQQELALKQAS